MDRLQIAKEHAVEPKSTAEAVFTSPWRLIPEGTPLSLLAQIVLIAALAVFFRIIVKLCMNTPTVLKHQVTEMKHFEQMVAAVEAIPKILEDHLTLAMTAPATEHDVAPKIDDDVEVSIGSGQLVEVEGEPTVVEIHEESTLIALSYCLQLSGILNPTPEVNIALEGLKKALSNTRKITAEEEREFVSQVILMILEVGGKLGRAYMPEIAIFIEGQDFTLLYQKAAQCKGLPQKFKLFMFLLQNKVQEHFRAPEVLQRVWGSTHAIKTCGTQTANYYQMINNGPGAKALLDVKRQVDNACNEANKVDLIRAGILTAEK